MIIERHPNAFYIRLPRFLASLFGFREVWVERAGGTLPWFAVDPGPQDRVMSIGRIHAAFG
ncbi:MAG: hypothetical protein ACK5XB_11980 [Rhodospirillales bacterium]|jgi:hypothetical protein